jgi:hypothetical protein
MDVLTKKPDGHGEKGTVGLAVVCMLGHEDMMELSKRLARR